MYKSALIVAVLVTSLQSSASETVKEFRGTGNSTTAIFTVESPWVLDWRLDGEYGALVALDVKLIDAGTDRYVGRVLYTEYIGNGVKLFTDHGQYKLRISSTLARWTLKIKQLTPEEAELYTPKEKK